MKKLEIIKVGGAVVEEPQALSALMGSFAGLAGERILVHGGGRTATRLAASLGIETRMVDGRRVTDAPMRDVVTMVYGGLVNKQVVAGLQAQGVAALGLTGADGDVVRSERRPPVIRTDGSVVDFGFVGDVRAVQAGRLARLLEEELVPVIAPLTHDGKGNLLNTNADTMASAVACALAGLRDAAGDPVYAVTLTFCFEQPGVLRDPADPASVIPQIDPAGFRTLVAEGVVSGGMVPKLENAFAALDRGVGQVRITRYDDLSGGTLIVKE